MFSEAEGRDLRDLGSAQAGCSTPRAWWAAALVRPGSVTQTKTQQTETQDQAQWPGAILNRGQPLGQVPLSWGHTRPPGNLVRHKEKGWKEGRGDPWEIDLSWKKLRYFSIICGDGDSYIRFIYSREKSIMLHFYTLIFRTFTNTHTHIHKHTTSGPQVCGGNWFCIHNPWVLKTLI